MVIIHELMGSVKCCIFLLIYNHRRFVSHEAKCRIGYPLEIFGDFESHHILLLAKLYIPFVRIRQHAGLIFPLRKRERKND